MIAHNYPALAEYSNVYYLNGKQCLPIRWLDKPVPLQRQGYRLSGTNQSWQMQGFYETAIGENIFRVETDSGEDLFIFQEHQKKGMKKLYLAAISPSSK